MHGPLKAVVAGAAIAAAAAALSGCSSSPSTNTAAPAATSTPFDPAARPTAPATAAPEAPAASPTPPPSSASASGTSRTIQGPPEDMQWGTVQVTVTLKGKQITAVQATYPTERPRSAYINEQAVPMLRQEVLQAQVAGLQNIYAISGATMTSETYYQSLMAALRQAGL